MAKTMAGTDGFINDIKKSICKSVSKKKTATKSKTSVAKSKTSSATKPTQPKTIKVKFVDNPNIQRKYIRMIEKFIIDYNQNKIQKATDFSGKKVGVSGDVIFYGDTGYYSSEMPQINSLVVGIKPKTIKGKTVNAVLTYMIGEAILDKHNNIFEFWVEDRPEHLQDKNKMFLSAQGLKNLKEWYS